MTYERDIVQKNIKYLMDKDGITSVTELSRRLKMQQSTLQRMISGEVKDPKYSTLKHIAAFFKVSPKDLAECDLQKLLPEVAANTDGEPHDVVFNYIPVVGNAQLGKGGYWSDMEYPVGNGDGYICWPTYDEEAYALKCVGDSMVPRIKEGEFVIVEPNTGYHPGDEVLVVTEEGEVMVKTFLFERDGFYHLLSVNEEHAPIRVAKEKMLRIQYVAGIAKASLWRLLKKR